MTDYTRDTLPPPAALRPLTPVELPDWPGEGRLYVRMISAGQATALPDETEAFLAALLLQSVVFADGAQVWATEAEAMEFPMPRLRPLIEAALTVNGLDNGKVDHAKRKSRGGRPASSSTASPSGSGE